MSQHMNKIFLVVNLITFLFIISQCKQADRSKLAAEGDASSELLKVDLTPRKCL